MCRWSLSAFVGDFIGKAANVITFQKVVQRGLSVKRLKLCDLIAKFMEIRLCLLKAACDDFTMVRGRYIELINIQFRKIFFPVIHSVE